MCSGQGSHYYQMGHELFLRHAGFRRHMEAMDRVVVELGGGSVLAALYDPARHKLDCFDEISLTHPAIFMIEIALAALLIEGGVLPDLVLGSSMGMFAAATLATLARYSLGKRAMSGVHAALSPYADDWQAFETLQNELA